MLQSIDVSLQRKQQVASYRKLMLLKIATLRTAYHNGLGILGTN